MARNKYFGVVEGFYRKPYTHEQRCDLMRFLGKLGLNTYVYAPKDDPYHRLHYEHFYPLNKLKELVKLHEIAGKNGIRFNYALAPGKKPETGAIIKKITRLNKAGIRDFSILYDDINVLRDRRTAEIQADTANRLLETLRNNDRDAMLFFCPTQYRGYKNTEYIRTVAARLDKKIGVFWTGSRVVSLRITEKQVTGITRIMSRPPLIWDNLFANDYMPPRTILRFPYKGRAPGIIDSVAGILINPMNEYRESKPLIYTAARFFNDPHHYEPRKAWKEATRIFLNNS